MSIALRVVWEVYGGKFAPLVAPSAEIVRLRPPRRDPEQCQKDTRKRLRQMSRCPGTLDDARVVLDGCNACRECFGL